MFSSLHFYEESSYIVTGFLSQMPDFGNPKGPELATHCLYGLIRESSRNETGKAFTFMMAIKVKQ